MKDNTKIKNFFESEDAVERQTSDNSRGNTR